MKPLTSNDLERMPCGMPDCNHRECSELFIHARCHMSSGSWVAYDKKRKVLVITCAKCKRHVGEIAVASRTWDGTLQ